MEIPPPSDSCRLCITKETIVQMYVFVRVHVHLSIGLTAVHI